MEDWIMLVVVVAWSWACYRLGRYSERLFRGKEPMSEAQRGYIELVCKQRGMNLPLHMSELTREEAGTMVKGLQAGTSQ